MDTQTEKAQRLEQIKEIRDFVEQSQIKTNEILSKFGWTIENLQKNKLNKQSGVSSTRQKKTKEECLSTFDLPTTAEKLVAYEKAIKTGKSMSGNDYQELVTNVASTSSSSSSSSSNIKQISNLMDIKKLKRDLKRRRMKHRVTKTAPLTFTEELHELINLQMEILAEKKSE